MKILSIYYELVPLVLSDLTFSVFGSLSLQEKDVKVFRLVSRGTVEEMKFLRQLYKTDLKNETLELDCPDYGATEGRFRGVAGDRNRKGELFGITNLLKYKDGNFKTYKSTVADSIKDYGCGVYREEDLEAAVRNMSEDEFKTLGEDTAKTLSEDTVFAKMAKQALTRSNVPQQLSHWSKPKRRFQLDEDSLDNERDDQAQAQSIGVDVPDNAATFRPGDVAPKGPGARPAQKDDESPNEDEYMGAVTQMNLDIFEHAPVQSPAAAAFAGTSGSRLGSIKEEDVREADAAYPCPAVLSSAVAAAATAGPEPDQKSSKSSPIQDVAKANADPDGDESKTNGLHSPSAAAGAAVRSPGSADSKRSPTPPSATLSQKNRARDLMNDILGGSKKKKKKSKRSKPVLKEE